MTKPILESVRTTSYFLGSVPGLWGFAWVIMVSRKKWDRGSKGQNAYSHLSVN